MSLGLQVLDKNEWLEYSEKAHLICFKENRPRSMERFDFTLLTIFENKPCGYINCREVDSESLYLQHGGVFPNVKGTETSYLSFLKCLDWASRNYKRVNALVLNTNKPMLKFCVGADFKVTGIRIFNTELYLEQSLEFKE